MAREGTPQDAVSKGSIASIDALGRTAFVTCQWRADESERPDPLFDDHIAAIFLGRESRTIADRLVTVMPEARDMILYRTRCIDDHLRGVLGEARQVVLLGAGFDTRAIRIGGRGIKYFELDKPALLDFKLNRLRRHGHQPPSTFVACDYLAEDFVSRLFSHGLDVAVPTALIWEGNTFFLPRPAIIQVLTRIHTSLRRFTIAFDYMSDRIISRSTGYAEITRFAEIYEAMGAPFVTGFRSIAELESELGLTIGRDETAADLQRRYFPGQGRVLSLLEFYSVAVLASGERGK